MKKRARTQIIFSIFFSVLFFCFACSSSDPDLNTATGTVIFDFKDEKSAPEARLAVFASAKSDTRRVYSVTMKNEATEYQWQSFSPQTFFSNGSYWVGYSNFLPRESENIPKGRYLFTFKDLAGDEASRNFNISYSDDLLKSNTENARTFLRPSNEERLALYDADGNLVFFDKKKSAWTDWEKIRREYNVAVKKRTVYCEMDLSVMVFLPVDEWKEPKPEISVTEESAESPEENADSTESAEPETENSEN